MISTCILGKGLSWPFLDLDGERRRHTNELIDYQRYLVLSFFW